MNLNKLLLNPLNYFVKSWQQGSYKNEINLCVESPDSWILQCTAIHALLTQNDSGQTETVFS